MLRRQLILVRATTLFLFLVGLCLVGVRAQPVALDPNLKIRHLADLAGPNPMRIARDPSGHSLYILNSAGNIYRVRLDAGSNGTLVEPIYDSSDHGVAGVAGFAIGPDGSFYLVGNASQDNNTRTVATVRRGTPGPGGQRTWATLARTVPYSRSPGIFNHLFNAIVVSPDGEDVYVNSGSRTDHGEDQGGQREVDLTSIILRLPATASEVVLPDDRDALRGDGSLFAEGVRNTFDLAFGPEGDLFGPDNGPDRDMPDELNWLREGQHYGFPWRMGAEDNPQQFDDYDPAADLLLDARYTAIRNGDYRNDPGFPPPPPVVFADPVINLGPDADRFRDPETGAILDASDLERTLSTFTAHRSPLGLVFDTLGGLNAPYRGGGFVLSWTRGDPDGDSRAGPFRDASEDLLHLDLTKLGETNYQARVTRLVGGFHNPVDAEMIGNRLYVIEWGGNRGLWEISFPADPLLHLESAPDHTLRLSLTGETGVRYEIETSGDLETWTFFAARTNVTGMIEWEEMSEPGSVTRFFRAIRAE